MRFRKLIKWFTPALIFTMTPAPALANDSDHAIDRMLSEKLASDDILFTTEDGVSLSDTAIADLGLEAENLGGDTYLVKVPWWIGTKGVLSELLDDEGIKYAEPDYAVFTEALSIAPDDPDFGGLWGMQPFPGANAVGAWEAGFTGSAEVYVAVLDTGIDYTHPDLAANMWVNSAEQNGTPGVDDDGNGYTDDIHGYDFHNERGDVLAGASADQHGTHVAGTIAAVGNNGIGVAGVGWSTKLISVKVLEGASGSLSAIIRGMQYVEHLRTQQGINIVATNNSYGSPRYSRIFEESINRHGNAGILFVAAAGNAATDSETNSHFPSSLNCQTEVRDFDCVVSVAASDTTGGLAAFSNYGSTRVDLAAPGVFIYSTVAQGATSYGYLSGTSMATPHVAGAIAVCSAANPGISAGRIKELLLETTTKTPSLAGTSVSEGALNIGALVALCADETVTSLSGAPTQFRATATYTNRVRLEWSDEASGEHGFTIRYGSGPNGCQGSSNSHLAHIGPGLNGFEVFDLEEAQFYCFSIRATRENQTSSAAQSNLTITFTSNLPFIYGKVLMADGVTPVEDVLVGWNGTMGMQSGAYTDSNGFYTVQATPGVSGQLNVIGPTSYTGPRSIQTTPRLPLSFVTGGWLTIQEDTRVDLTLPEINTINVQVVRESDGSVVPGAKLGGKTVNRDSTLCRIGARDWLPSPLLSQPSGYGFCSYGLPDGVTTDQNGKFSFEVIDAFQLGGTNATFPIEITATDGANALHAGRGRVNTDVSADLVVTLLEPKTITGRVTLFGGTTPVPKAIVSAGPRLTTTDADGYYSLQLQRLDRTSMQVKFHETFIPEVIPTLVLSGQLAANSLGPVDWELPEQHIVEIKVVDELTGEVQAGSFVEFRKHSWDDGLGCRVSARDYAPSVSLTYEQAGTCYYFPYGNTTDSEGIARFAVLDSFYQKGHDKHTLVFNASHPTNEARAGEVTVGTSSAGLATIAIGGNPQISGQLLMSDGETPVANARMTYSTASYTTSTFTDETGFYSLRVPHGVPGNLSLNQCRTLNSAYPDCRNTTPAIPQGFWTGGGVTPVADMTIDLTLPLFRTLNLKVVDAQTSNPVANADTYVELLTGPLDQFHCGVSPRDYSPSPLLTYGSRVCGYLPGWDWIKNLTPSTDKDGELTLTLLDGWYQAANAAPVRIRVQHPMDAARVGEVIVPTNADQDVLIEIAGTPSQPKQPTAIATEGKVTLTWSEPWNGGAFIDYYKVWIADSPDGPFAPVTSGSCAGEVPPDWRSCEVTNLEASRPYYFAIIAHNELGYSEASVAAMAVPLPTEKPLLATPIPTIRGVAATGQTLEVESGSWDEGVTFDYQWLRNGAVISGATGPSYLLAASDLGSRISVSVTGSKPSWISATKTSEPTNVVGNGFARYTNPRITGVQAVGKTLKVSTGTWSPRPKFAYQWNCDGVPISGAKKSSIKLTRSQAQCEITVTVTATARGITTLRLTSQAAKRAGARGVIWF